MMKSIWVEMVLISVITMVAAGVTGYAYTLDAELEAARSGCPVVDPSCVVQKEKNND